MAVFSAFATTMGYQDAAMADEMAGSVAHIEEEMFAKVAELSPPGPIGHVTLIESPVIGPDVDLYFVDLFAAPDQPKVGRLDLGTKTVENVYSDDYSVFLSVQFIPFDGEMYVNDYVTGEVHRVDMESRNTRHQV